MRPLLKAKTLRQGNDHPKRKKWTIQHEQTQNNRTIFTRQQIYA